MERGKGPSAGITLRGWPAVVALVIVAGLYGLTFVVSRRALDDKALAPIRRQLQGEYTAALLPGVDPSHPDPDAVARLTALERIEFASVSVRGSEGALRWARPSGPGHRSAGALSAPPGPTSGRGSAR
jgi:hypothetical protein